MIHDLLQATSFAWTIGYSTRGSGGLQSQPPLGGNSIYRRKRFFAINAGLADASYYAGSFQYSPETFDHASPLLGLAADRRRYTRPVWFDTTAAQDAASRHGKAAVAVHL
jgi:hypothetical protein